MNIHYYITCYIHLHIDTYSIRIYTPSLKMMNFGTKKLDHILSISKSSSDYHSLRYQDGKDSNSQGVFVKASPLITFPPIVKVSYH